MRLFRKSNVKVASRKRRIRFVLRSLVFLSISFVLALVLRHFSLHLEKLQIQNLVVEGSSKQFSRESILSQAGVKVGMPLFLVDLRTVVEKLQKNSWVDFVKVSRKIPHTLTIQVIPHEPRLLLSVGRYYYVGKNAEIFKELGSSDSKDFPILTGLNSEEMEANPSQTREILQQALKLLSTYEQQTMYENLGLSEIHYDRAAGFSLIPEKKRLKILVGFEGFDTKLERLKAAYEKIKNLPRSFASIDLNYEEKIILTL